MSKDRGYGQQKKKPRTLSEPEPPKPTPVFLSSKDRGLLQEVVTALHTVNLRLARIEDKLALQSEGEAPHENPPVEASRQWDN